MTYAVSDLRTGDEKKKKSLDGERPRPPPPILTQKRGSTPTPLSHPLERETEGNYEVGKSGEISIFGRVEIGFSKFIYVRKVSL